MEKYYNTMWQILIKDKIVYVQKWYNRICTILMDT